MRRISKILAVTAASALILTGCSTTGGTGGDSQSASSEVKAWAAKIKEKYNGDTITIAAQTHPSTQAMQKMTDEFTKLTGVNVRWDIVDQNSLQQKIELDYQSNNAAYDAVMVDGFWMSSFAKEGIVQDVTDRLAKTDDKFFDYNDIVPAYSKGLQEVNGKSYGVQIAGESRFIGYRTDIFKKYDKTPPKTMAEYLKDAQFFAGKEPGLYGTSMRGQKGIQFASGLLTIMYQFSTGFWDPKTGADQIASDDNVTALQYYIDLLKTAPKDVSSYTNEEALSAFSSGHTAMWFDATAIAPSILDPDASTVADKVAFVPPPTGPRGQYGALAGWGLSLAAHAKNADAAWAFIEYMTSKATSKTYVSDGGVPTRTSTMSNPQTAAQKLYYPAMLKALDASNNLAKEGISWLPKVENLDSKLTTIGNYGSEALAGELTAKEALEKASADIKAAG